MRRTEISNLDFIKMEPRGKAVKGKFWVYQNGIKKLVKLSDEGIDQDVMESLSSVILKKLKIDCIDAQLGQDSIAGKKGCLISCFLDDDYETSYELTNWKTIRNDDVEEELRQCFEQVIYRYGLVVTKQEELNQIKKDYIRTIFGKCIIENFDTKLENIGLIFNERTMSYRLPPSYDNGFAFKSYNSSVNPICCIGNQFFEINLVIKHILNNYFEKVEDIIPLLDNMVCEDLSEIITMFENEISEEKQNYIINYLCEINNNIQLTMLSRRR